MQTIERNQAFELASPFPYVLATVLTPDGRPNAIGLGWWTFTSWEPLHLAISVGHKKFSHECLEHSGEFVLNFPSAGMARGAWLCGTKSGRGMDKLVEGDLATLPSTVVKPPTLADATVAYEVKVHTKVPTGDHTLYLGEVVAIRGNPELPAHLYSIHYKRLIALGADGSADWDLTHRG